MDLRRHWVRFPDGAPVGGNDLESESPAEQEAARRATGLGLNWPTFRYDSGRQIAGVNQRYTPETRRQIPQQWERFAPQGHEIPGRKGDDFFGVSWACTADGCFEYLTGVAVAAAPAAEEYFTLLLSPRRYAVFAHTGHVSAIPGVIDVLWSKWVPACGLKVSNAPCFERYTPEFDACTGLGGMELWIPLDEVSGSD